MGTKTSGFASMSAARRREIASLGGKAAQAAGTAHQWDSHEAKAAGKIGGHISRGGRGKHADTSKPTHPRAKG